MKPSANKIRYADGRCGDYLQDAVRRYALEHDWHRLRDQDAEWRHFQKIVTRATVIIAALFVIGALTGCDTPEKKCARWDIAVMGYEMCASDARCRMHEYDYRHMIEAKYERAKWCPEEKL